MIIENLQNVKEFDVIPQTNKFSALQTVDTPAARMYNIVRLCPGRLLGHPFVRIPASPSHGVGVGPQGSHAYGPGSYRSDGGEAKTRRKK